MKYNLKNRPIDETYPGFKVTTNAWFEGFEKELRSNIKELRASKCSYHQLCARVLEEILGE